MRVACLRIAVTICWSGLVVNPLFAQNSPAVDAQDFSAELPHFPPVESRDALGTFVVQPGLKLEQVAAEPLVASPVAIAWDEDCRLYVCEMRGYSERRDEQVSRIRCLHDDNGDGCYERVETFVDGLLWPTALACWNGGLFVGDAPHVYYCKDTNGDGRADVRQIVYTGFPTSNVQGLLNSFRWTLDNRIHGSASSLGGNITRPDVKEFLAVGIRGRDFEFDPRTRDFRPTSGGAQHGMAFDDWGVKFVSSNSDHLQQVMFEDRYVARNAYLDAPSARVSIAADGPQAEVFRSSPVEPWRVVRSRLRASGAVPGAVEGGGRPAGYFTGATGVTIYRGDLLPDEYRGLAVVADVGSNLVHRKRLTRQGVQYRAERIDVRSELLASTDTWFRPVQFANGPDGALYVIDMYREIIEHPASIPQAIKKHFDTSSGRDRGRLYRLVPDGFRPGPLPKLSRLPTGELVRLLEHSNAWHRETAARLLYERQDPAAVGPLGALASESSSPLGRMHALYALRGLDRLTSEQLERSLADPSAHVRQHAIRLSEPFLPDAKRLADCLARLADDDDPAVRYQLAFTLGYLPTEQRLAVLETAVPRWALQATSDRWLWLAVQSSVGDDAAELLAALVSRLPVPTPVGVRPLLASLATQVSRRNQLSEVALVLAALRLLDAGNRELVNLIARALLAGRGSVVRQQILSDDRDWLGVRSSIAGAPKIAIDAQRSLVGRLEAISWLALGPPQSAVDTARQLLDSRAPAEIQLATVQALSEFAQPEVVQPIVERWSGLSPSVKSAALEMLLARPARAHVLLDALEAGAFPVAEIDAPRAQRLMALNDPLRRPKAQQLLSANQVARRPDVLDAYQSALKLPGDVARGKQTFVRVCAACHRADHVGYELGPNLSTMKQRGPAAILLNVLDPSREVNPQFVNYVCLTTDGRSLTGLLAAETATSIALRRAENQQDTVLRIEIDELRSTGLSIMPEGLERQLDPQALADLIAYVMQLP